MAARPAQRIRRENGQEINRSLLFDRKRASRRVHKIKLELAGLGPPFTTCSQLSLRLSRPPKLANGPLEC